MDFNEFCEKHNVTEEERESLYRYYMIMKHGDLFMVWMMNQIENWSGKKVILKKKKYVKKD